MRSTNGNESVFLPFFYQALVLGISVFLSHTAWSQDISQVINTGKSVHCGVETCQTIPIYKTCANAACGSVTKSEDCGQHWGAWRTPGSGGDNPCQQLGCRRVGGSIGVDHKIVNWQPKQKDKYQCQRDVVITNTCQNIACGIEIMKTTGAVENYATCLHPAHGLNQTAWDAQYAAGKDKAGVQEMLQLIQVLANQSKVVPEAQSPTSDYNGAVALTLEYLNIAAIFPADHAERLTKIASLFEQLKGGMSPDSLRPILGDTSYIALTRRISVLTYVCQAQ